jgi:hypothetical protein
VTRDNPPRVQGPRIRLETRLDPRYQEALRIRAQRGVEIMQERLRDPDERERLRYRLRPRGAHNVTCTKCGATFTSRLQGAASRKVLLCGEDCRRRRKQAARAQRRISDGERVGRITVSVRRRRPHAQLYEKARALLTEPGQGAARTLSQADRHLLERYLGLADSRATSLRGLTSQTGMTRHALERRLMACFGVLLGQGELGRVCAVCGRQFLPPYLSSDRQTCGAVCERKQARLHRSADHLREAARRQGRELAPRLTAVAATDFTRLADGDAALLRSYYGLDGQPPATKSELANRFGLTVWKVDAVLKRATAMLLEPASQAALDHDARREQMRARIGQLRRAKARPFARALEDLGADAFDKLDTRDRDLVKRYYGIGEERSWTRRELAEAFGMSTARVEDLVNAAVSDLIGTEVGLRFDRVCVVCGDSFAVRGRSSQPRTCGPQCRSELKRAAAKASAQARRKLTSGGRRASTRASRRVLAGLNR